MGSERLGHMFTAKDPTFKGEVASSKHEAMSHTSGTHPVSLSNGPKSLASTKKITRHKPNSKHRKLLKLHARQLAYLETTYQAIESLSKPISNEQHEQLLASKRRLDELKIKNDQLRDSPSVDDHEHFDQIKMEIDELIEEFKLLKLNNPQPDSMTTLDLLFGVPLDASESDDDDPNKPKTLIYF